MGGRRASSCLCMLCMCLQAESSRAGPSGVEGQEQSLPGTPRMQTVTPAQLPPGILAPAASTAMSAPAPLALAELMHPSAIARKWGHALLDSKQTATPSTANTLVRPQPCHVGVFLSRGQDECCFGEQRCCS